MKGLLDIVGTLERGFPVLALHVVVAIGLLVGLVALHQRLTAPLYKHVQAGNPAAAVTLAGLYVSYAIPIAFCLHGSTSAFDILIWAIPLAGLQFAIFKICDRSVGDLVARVLEDGDLSIVIYIAGVRIAIAIILASAIAI